MKATNWKNVLKAASVFSVILLLGSCGGGRDADTATIADGSSAGGSTSQARPTVFTSEGRSYNSCSESPECSGNPFAPFTVFEASAPADGAVISGVVRIQVRGIDMANVELLPSGSYTPIHGKFIVTGDQTLAWLDFDTRKLPNGPLPVRVSAFDAPAGQPGREIVAMQARTWTINNTGTLPAGFAATLTSAPANGAVVSGITRLEVSGTGLANVELLPAEGYLPVLGLFNISEDRRSAWLDFDTSSLPDGARNVKINAYSVTPGQPGGMEIAAMPARQWTFSNGKNAADPFIASVTMAPPHGATVSGIVTLEVRGNNLENVELLPANGYTPILASFSLSANKQFAEVNIDTRTLPNAPLNVRISAYDVGPGVPGTREIIAMPARQWKVQN